MNAIHHFQFDQDDLLCLTDRKTEGAVKRWWISQEGLIRNLDGLTESYFWKRIRPLYLDSVSAAKRGKDVLPDTGKAWRWARINGRFYYCLDNIPDQAPASYRSRLPRPDQMPELKEIAAQKSRLNSLESVFKGRLEESKNNFTQHYYGYSSTQMADLSRACAALQILAELGADHRYNYAWMKDAGNLVDTLDIRYLPCNWRRLKEKIEAVRTGGLPVWEVVALPRCDNQNARKLNDPELESWIIQMRGMPQNFTGAHIIRKIRQMCELTGKLQPSESWISQMLATPAVQFLTSAGRYGERGRHGQLYREYTPVANALFANDCWQLDGTRVNFIPWIGEDGREKFLYMVVCRDVHSGMVLGVSFGLAEDRWMYVEALGMAAKRTKTLPYEVAIDRFPGHNTPEWKTIEARMEAIGIKVSYKHTATAKAQLERWFGTLQSVFFQESPYYYGEGIQSKRTAAHRSAEYIRAIRKVAKSDGWCMDLAIREAAWCIGKYNATALSTYSRKFKSIEHSPEQLFQTSEKPHGKALVESERVMLFGLMKKVTIRNSMIRTEIQTVEYHYAVRDYEVVKNHRSVWLAYDLDDLNTAWVFEDDDKRITNPKCLGSVDLLPRVLVHGSNPDYKQLGKDTNRKGQIENKRKAELEAIKGSGSDVGLLLNGFGRKAEAEAAETDYLLAEIEAASVKPLPLALPMEPEEDTTPPARDIDEARLVLDMM